jgi:methylase of polypeptide subunit release factors
MDVTVTTLTTGSMQGDQSIAMQPPAAVFCDDAESQFYAHCVKDFLLRNLSEPLQRRPIAELGTGTGEAIASVLAEPSFPGEVHGYEIQPEACAHARQLLLHRNVRGYRVFHQDFFAVARHYRTGYAISNAPYLPASDAAIKMPELWGGPDGSRVIKRLLRSGFERLVVTVPSFSNPLAIIDHAARHGYKVADFAVRTMPFGPYSSEPKVQAQIERLQSARLRKAFTSADRYCLAGVLWTKENQVDHRFSLEVAITSLGFSSVF